MQMFAPAGGSIDAVYVRLSSLKPSTDEFASSARGILCVGLLGGFDGLSSIATMMSTTKPAKVTRSKCSGRIGRNR